jgi:hypothetical protein
MCPADEVSLQRLEDSLVTGAVLDTMVLLGGAVRLTAVLAYYQQLRDRNIGHQAALRQVANRLVGILHGCLKTHTRYHEHTAWSHHMASAA